LNCSLESKIVGNDFVEIRSKAHIICRLMK